MHPVNLGGFRRHLPTALRGKGKAARVEGGIGGMLGIDDPLVWSGYLLAIGLAIACVVYGILKWNAEED
jgi:hypothetical protein